MANRIEKTPPPLPGDGGTGGGGTGGGGYDGGEGLPPYSTPCFNAILARVRRRWFGDYVEWVPTESNITAYFRVVLRDGAEIQVMGRCVNNMTSTIDARWRQIAPTVGGWHVL